MLSLYSELKDAPDTCMDQFTVYPVKSLWPNIGVHLLQAHRELTEYWKSQVCLRRWEHSLEGRVQTKAARNKVLGRILKTQHTHPEWILCFAVWDLLILTLAPAFFISDTMISIHSSSPLRFWLSTSPELHWPLWPQPVQFLTLLLTPIIETLLSRNWDLITPAFGQFLPDQQSHVQGSAPGTCGICYCILIHLDTSITRC
jgi:hypothetical protein